MAKNATEAAIYRHGLIKFPNASLMHTSKGRGWTGVAAELRSHPAGDLPAFLPEQMEITLAVRSSTDATVYCWMGDGHREETRAQPGTLWLCPPGVQEDSIHITEALPEMLHLYVPAEQFRALSVEAGGPAITPGSIRYIAGLDDDLVRQIGYAILRELKEESASGKLLVESLALALAAHLGHAYSGVVTKVSPDTLRAGALDGPRLQRVLAYINDNPEAELTVAELASVACLSRFHFARAFREATGHPPHRYVSAKRLERARRLLNETHESLAEIALYSCFSSQANFTRAFRRATGMSPGEYRRRQALSQGR
jgi:AraC family transcriptional regulator